MNSSSFAQSLPNTRPPSPLHPSVPQHPNDLHGMSDTRMRPSLSTSLSDFALNVSSSPSSISMDVRTLSYTAHHTTRDEPQAQASPLGLRFRRPTLSGVKGGPFADLRVQSPLALSFTLPPARKASLDHPAGLRQQDEPMTYRDRDSSTADDSPASGSDVNTPPLLGPFIEEPRDARKESHSAISRAPSPSGSTTMTPAGLEAGESSTRVSRRYSHPPKMPRLLSLVAESHPEETELKSEAQFQRLIKSVSGLPLGQNRTGRPSSEKGRYPEEAGDDEVVREDTPTDDGFDDDDISANNHNGKAQASSSDPIDIVKPHTPASLGRDPFEDVVMSVSDSPGLMDVDMGSLSSSPSFAFNYPPPAVLPQWRQTPPPTSSAVRTSKRKYEDRFDPYAPSSKRRAVSPSIASLRDGLTTPIVIPRSPILRTRGSFSQTNSAATSPTVAQCTLIQEPGPSHTNMPGLAERRPLQSHHRSGSMSSIASSPTIRAPLMLASPVLRPVTRLGVVSKKAMSDIEGEREIDGAGDGVNSLNLG